MTDSLSGTKSITNPFASFTNFENSDYRAIFKGPILLTAPHTTDFTLGDGSPLSTQRDHLLESNLGMILPKLVYEIDQILGEGSASYMIWNFPRIGSTMDLDPNYLNDV